MNIGIVWAGNKSHSNGHHRDCSLAYFMRLVEVPGVQLHSLQMGEPQSQLGELGAYGLVQDRAPEIMNFLDTAQIVARLDLVISVDTAVGHLAGAMGVPCWLLLNQMGRDFRHGATGDKSRWYASQRIFRRGLDEDWGDLMDRVKAALAAVVA